MGLPYTLFSAAAFVSLIKQVMLALSTTSQSISTKTKPNSPFSPFRLWMLSSWSRFQPMKYCSRSMLWYFWYISLAELTKLMRRRKKRNFSTLKLFDDSTYNLSQLIGCFDYIRLMRDVNKHPKKWIKINWSMINHIYRNWFILTL